MKWWTPLHTYKNLCFDLLEKSLVPAYNHKQHLPTGLLASLSTCTHPKSKLLIKRASQSPKRPKAGNTHRHPPADLPASRSTRLGASRASLTIAKACTCDVRRGISVAVRGRLRNGGPRCARAQPRLPTAGPPARNSAPAVAWRSAPKSSRPADRPRPAGPKGMADEPETMTVRLRIDFPFEAFSIFLFEKFSGNMLMETLPRCVPW